MRAPLAVLSIAAGLLSACCTRAPNDLIVVLPGSDGHVGAVVVEAAGQKMMLDKAYAGVRPGPAASGPVEVSAQEVEQAFGDALGARPIPPKSYTLYFESGSNELSPKSKPTMEAMLAEISERKAVEIVITGHTDTVGSANDNDRLSLDRARAVEQRLTSSFAARGVSSDSVAAAGRGERELLVKTGDQVAEPRNRRVEITVR